ncbi:hypothetical protein [Acidimangrovimonas pyrenivorans]
MTLAPLLFPMAFAPRDDHTSDALSVEMRDRTGRLVELFRPEEEQKIRAQPSDDICFRLGFVASTYQSLRRIEVSSQRAKDEVMNDEALLTTEDEIGLAEIVMHRLDGHPDFDAFTAAYYVREGCLRVRRDRP